MLAKTTLDPMQIKQAELLAEQKWGSEWRSKRLDRHFGPIIEYPHETALSRKSYLLATAPQQEAKVEKALRAVGFDAFLPKEPKSIRVGHVKRHTVMRPMLPGYLFPIFDEHRDHWQIIKRPDKDGKNGIEGVLRLFLWGDRPVPMPDDAVQRLREREIDEQMRGNLKKTAAPFIAMPGHFVQIDDGGPWNGFIAEVVDLWERGSVLEVELDVFGRKTRLRTPVGRVRSVS